MSRNCSSGLCQLRSAASAEAQPERDTREEFVEIGSGDLTKRDDEIVRQQVFAFPLAVRIRRNGAVCRFSESLSYLSLTQLWFGLFPGLFYARNELLPIFGRSARASATLRHARYYKLD